mgnify:CR=1 FL=1
MTEFAGGQKLNISEQWEDYFENPKNYWDNRVDKVSSVFYVFALILVFSGFQKIKEICTQSRRDFGVHKLHIFFLVSVEIFCFLWNSL